MSGYNALHFECTFLEIYNGAKPNITWQMIPAGGTMMNVTESSGNTAIIQYDHTGYFQLHSPSLTNNGLQVRCVATHPDSPTEIVYSDWASAEVSSE